MTTSTPGRLTRKDLLSQIESGDIDTVILAITDMQGRLQGKRVDARFFVDDLADGVVEGCSYLLASDVDMNTVDGFALTSWERGTATSPLRQISPPFASFPGTKSR